MTTPKTVHGAHPKRTIAALCTGTALSALNSGMIAVALATLRRDFELNIATVTWIITVYYLASAALQPIMGRLADRFGPRRLFVFGMVVVMLSGVLGALAPSFWLLCVARVLLAVGTATAFPSAAAMLRGIAAASGRSAQKMIGRIQMVDTGTAAIGPVVGGVLITALGWQSIFWINIPLAAVALFSTLALAPADGARRKTRVGTTLIESDIPGILAFTITIVALLMFLLGLPADPRWWLLPIMFAAGAAFTWRELRFAKPFIDLRMLATNSALMRVYVCFTVVNLVFYSVLFGLPQYLEENGGYRADAVGALLIPLAAFTVLLAPFIERLIDRRGIRFTLVAGGIGLAVATAFSSVLALSTSVAVVLVVTAAIGIPSCILIIALTQALYAAARPEEEGEAAGLFQTARCIGGITSTVVVGISFSSGAIPANWMLIAAVITTLAIAYVVLSVVWRSRAVSSAEAPAT